MISRDIKLFKSPGKLAGTLDSKSMNYQTFFRVSLLLPVLAIGLFEFGLMLYGQEFSNSLPAIVTSMMVDSKIGIEMGWIQYLALCAFLAWGFGRWSLQQSLLNGVLGPIYYGILMLISLFIYANIVGDHTAEQVGIFAAVLSISYGYVYVAAILVSYYALKQFGAIRT